MESHLFSNIHDHSSIVHLYMCDDKNFLNRVIVHQNIIIFGEYSINILYTYFMILSKIAYFVLNPILVINLEKFPVGQSPFNH